MIPSTKRKCYFDEIFFTGWTRRYHFARGLCHQWRKSKLTTSTSGGDDTISSKWHLRFSGYDTISHISLLYTNPWWRHQMEIFSALLARCAGNSPVTCEFPAQRPVTRSFDVFYDLRLNRRLSKQSGGWWFETPSRSLWRHRNGFWYSAQLRYCMQHCNTERFWYGTILYTTLNPHMATVERWTDVTMGILPDT